MVEEKLIMLKARAAKERVCPVKIAKETVPRSLNPPRIIKA
jgi:hypothetical protein